MDLSKIPLFKAMSQRMAWLNERQSVLAQNVANADTPNYRPSDLKALSFAELVGGSSSKLKLAATEGSHLTGIGADAPFRPETDRKAQVSPSGNGVSLEEEMLKVSNTATDYQLTTTLYKQHIALVKMALDKGS
ncbi:MAG: flagellar basal body rod protein FlgB [Alphaproteobacteria bacterium]|nr:flagellar basal body rod protein FlgB [Alphaproteobacteria bacterium]